MISQERKDELYDRMIGWISEKITDSKDLFDLLHGEFGMSKWELHDHCIESLDEFFPEMDPKDALAAKVAECLRVHQERWYRMTPQDLVDNVEAIEATARMAKVLPDSVSREEAEYLLRFKNPLEVVSDMWASENGMDTVVDNEMAHILWQIVDQRIAEGDYELEPEFYSQQPKMTM